MTRDEAQALVEKHGSQSAAARAIGVSQGAIWNWLNPDWRPRYTQRLRQDPDYRKKLRAYNRAYYRRRMDNDPEFRARILAHRNRHKRQLRDAEDLLGRFGLTPEECPDGVVYFVQGTNGGPIKIGHTTQDPLDRLCALRVGSPITLELIALLPGCPRVERRLHDQFDAYRLHGEWFEPAPEVLRAAEVAA